MPAGTKVAAAETALKRSARKKGYKGRRADAYVYGTLNKIGLKHGNVTTAAGMQRSMHARAADRRMTGY
jgi:hypothetical protein